MSENLLEIKNLKKIYHNNNAEVLSLNDISFNIKDKDFVAIVGPSGCGKSTILSILAKITNKTEGIISFNKENPVIGYMLQDDSLFPWKNVLDNCLLGLEIKHELTNDNIKNAKNLLTKYGLSDFISSYPDNLSGGMKQRVALIRTLAINPDILLLDEPFSSLDYQTRLTLSDDLYNIIKKEGKTAIIVTHDIAEAISMCDKVIILTNRPSTIKKILDINLNNKSIPTENRKNKDFVKYYESIWKELDQHV